VAPLRVSTPVRVAHRPGGDDHDARPASPASRPGGEDDPVDRYPAQRAAQGSNYGERRGSATTSRWCGGGSSTSARTGGVPRTFGFSEQGAGATTMSTRVALPSDLDGSGRPGRRRQRNRVVADEGARRLRVSRVVGEPSGGRPARELEPAVHAARACRRYRYRKNVRRLCAG